MSVEVDLSAGWRLSADRSQDELDLAARELERALGEPGEGAVEVALSHAGGGGEGFHRRAEPERIEIHGDSARGALFGAYAALEELGARWPWPGKVKPTGERARLEERVESAPALPGRCLVIGEAALLEEAEGWIEWAARNRLNSLFVHTSTSAEPSGSAPEALWRERREAAIALARERAMSIEHGGHLLPELLGEDDVRALGEGRVPEGARRTIEQHVRTHPEADVLHLWGADLPPEAGGSVSEAALRSANAVAEVAEGAGREALVAYLAYHDTEEVPARVQPRENVCLVFAPRERCYEHPLADPTCRENPRHREVLEAQLEHFADAGPPRVFEYWFDAMLFSGGVPDLSEVIAADLAFYREAGVHTVQILMTGHGRQPPPHPNPPAFARRAWNPGS